MTAPTIRPGGWPDSPVRHSETLGRALRQDDLDTLGMSTQTLAEAAIEDGHWELASELSEYFAREIEIMNDVLFVWATDILDYRLTRAAATETGLGGKLLSGWQRFRPGVGDLERARTALGRQEAAAAAAAIELMRVRWAAQHDGLVVWICELLTEIAQTFGEEAVRESVTLAYEHIWKPRYELWGRMTPELRLQLSVEGMRGGHLSGPSRRGDVGVSDEGDRYVLSLDPCGSCGVLRRGDRESGRPPHRSGTNQEPHPWTQGRTGMSWYSVHSMIALEHIQMSQGRPPLRPLEDCDLPDRPCRWFIYKDAAKPRRVHYERQGFLPPADAPDWGPAGPAHHARRSPMSRLDGLPLLPIQAIGSAAVPPWVWLLRDAAAEDRLGPSDIAESLRDAARIALLDEQEAGYDVVSDGEMLRADFTRNFHGHIQGIEAIEYERRLGHPGPDQLDAFRATASISAPNGYGLVAETGSMLALTDQPFVTPLQGPVTQAFRIDPGDVYADKGEVAWALVPDINRELKAAVAAGAHFVQLDEPAFWIMPGGLPEMVEIANACIDGVAAMTSLHLCFGNFRGRPATAHRSYSAFAPYFPDLAYDALSLEFANRSMWQAELWAAHGGDKTLVGGVIDVKGRDAETPAIVVERIRTLLRSVRPEKLWLSADCGYSQTARPLAVEKMRALVAAARTLRGELAR